MRFAKAILPSLAFILSVSTLTGQSTQGLIGGQVFHRRTGRVLAGVRLRTVHAATGRITEVETDRRGRYNLLSLSPGIHVVRAEKPGFQPVEVHALELFVGGRIDLRIALRELSDTYSQETYAAAFVPGSDAIVHVYAADLLTTRPEPLAPPKAEAGPMQSTVSWVVDTEQLRHLPLSGRDTYAMLALLPGVTADNPTARGLGLSGNGQRATASNFLLDGVENNDPLLTGPLTVLPPETVQEYRVSTSNYSAEFGRAAGFVANAITRSGGRDLHGLFYGYLSDSALSANSYQHKAGLNTSTRQRTGQTVPRQPQTDLHAGFWLGGPLTEPLLWSAAYERFRSRGSADEFPFQVPFLDAVRRCNPSATALRFLESAPPPIPLQAPAATGCDTLSVPFVARPSLSRDRHTALGRLDWLASDRSRVLFRAAVSRIAEPHFIYSVYPGLSSALAVDSDNLTAAHVWTPRSWLSNEARLGWRSGAQGWDRPLDERPALDTFLDGATRHPAIFLPSAPAPAAFRYRYIDWEAADTLRLHRGPHVLFAGGGLLLRHSRSLFNFRESGLFFFNTLQDFIRDQPARAQVSVRRLALPQTLASPSFRRRRQTREFYLFLQDNWKITPNLGVNLGVRYDSFGAPRNTGDQDPFFLPGPGGAIEQRLSGAALVQPPGDQTLYRPDRNDVAARLGAYLNPFGSGRAIFRGGYGIFYDRPFDNLTLGTRNNGFELAQTGVQQYPAVALDVPAAPPSRRLDLPRAVWIDPDLRTPYTHSWFAGVEDRLGPDLLISALAHGARGRKLIGADLVNRRAPESAAQAGRLSAAIPRNVVYRSNFASSDYHALTASARFRGQTFHAMAAYTWSHSIDNQSDPLQGSFEDFNISRGFNIPARSTIASLTREFDPRADRGDSDFDQRHNLLLWTLWTPRPPPAAPWARALLRDWQISSLAGFRSGFPFDLVSSENLQPCPSSNASSAAGELVRNRPSLLPGAAVLRSSRSPAPGGFQLLDPSALCHPPPGVLGNLGRNSLAGPGFWNVDFSIARSFPVPWMKESASLQLRLDFFNLFNHANLGSPEGDTASPAFGEALLGRQGIQPSFPSLTPLDQLPRQIQIQVRLIF